MGRILKNPSVTSSNVHHYIQQATQDYSTFLNAAPNFCKYYSKNRWKSTHDRSLESYDEVVGADSPLKFDSIENLPIYRIENSSFGTEITDFGVTGNVSSSAILLPDTIIPSVDDLFEIEYNTAKKLFLVVDVEQDNYNNSKFYKITFRLSPHGVEDVEDQVENELTVDYTLIGKAKDPIVSKSHFDLYLKLEDIYDGLLENYRDRFYDRESGLFVGSFQASAHVPVVDPIVNEFIAKRGLNDAFDGYRSFRYQDRDAFKVRSSDYRSTVFWLLEKRPENVADALTNGEFVKKYQISRSVADRYSLNWFSQKDYRFVDPSRVDGDVPLTELSVVPFREEFFTALGDGITDSLQAFEKLVAGFLLRKVNEENYHELPDALEDVEESESDYHLVPLALAVIRQYRAEIIGRPISE